MLFQKIGNILLSLFPSIYNVNVIKTDDNSNADNNSGNRTSEPSIEIGTFNDEEDFVPGDGVSSLGSTEQQDHNFGNSQQGIFLILNIPLSFVVSSNFDSLTFMQRHYARIL